VVRLSGQVNLSRVKATIASVIGHLKHGDTWGLRRKMFEHTVFMRESAEKGEEAP